MTSKDSWESRQEKKKKENKVSSDKIEHYRRKLVWFNKCTQSYEMLRRTNMMVHSCNYVENDTLIAVLEYLYYL